MKRVIISKKRRQTMNKRQKWRCFYCNCKFDMNNRWKHPTIDHVIPFCEVWDNTEFVLSCARCNHLKWNISKELFEDWYICVNFKPWYDIQSYNKEMKVRNPIKWYQKKFPTLFWWSSYHKKYKTTLKLYK